jgi:hypothetical protein
LGKTIALRFEIVRFLKKPALYALKTLNFKLTLPSLGRDRVPDELRAATHVFIRRDGHVPPLAQLYEGPFRVVSKEEKVYHVQRGPRSEVISVDRLKAYVGRDEPEVAVPPARGRPKKPPDD